MLDSERIALKIRKMRPSLTLGLKSLVSERQRAGLPVYDFGLGETKGQLNPRIREAGERAFREEHTMYSDPAGLPDLRQAILRWLDLEKSYGIEDVVVSTGAKQSLFNIFLAICNPGDTMFFDAAPWVSYEPLALTATAAPVLVLPKHDEHMKVTARDLERNLERRPHARAFLVNNPCNPTAQLYDEREINDLLDVCARREVYFILDRLYWRILFDGRKFPEPRIDERTKRWLIQVDGLSKNWRRTGGLRIGWTVAPRDVSAAMINLQSHYTAGPAVPTQRAALAALDIPYDDEMVRDLQKKRDLLRREAEGIPHVNVWPTPATFYSFWDVRGTFGRATPEGGLIASSDDLAEYLVRHAGVVTASGKAFFQDGYLRLSFATPDEEIVAGMRAAREALAALGAQQA